MKMPDDWRLWYNLSTDSRKKIYLRFSGNLNRSAENYSTSTNYSLSLTAKPLNTLTISLSPGYSSSRNDLQYLKRMELNGEDESYLFATVKQQIIRMSLRINYNITPDLTIQYWGQPFSGDISYSDYKIILDPNASEYSDRFQTYTQSEITRIGDSWYVDNGEYSFDFSDPGFKSNEWLSNLVIRWEFLPGSTAYLVWSQTREYTGGPGAYSLGDNLDYLFTNKKPDNIFLLKFSYRFGLR